MKGKLIFFALGIGFNAFIQLLLYYLTPTNWATIVSAIKTIPGLLYNVIWLLAAILVLILAWRMMKAEDIKERLQQSETIKTAVKAALKEDREEQQQIK
jgi:hypothetical protein